MGRRPDFFEHGLAVALGQRSFTSHHVRLARRPPAIGGKGKRSFPQVDTWPGDKLARFAGAKPYFC